MTDKSVVLFTGDNCHLCQQATDLLYPLLTEWQVTLVERNISGDAELQEKYGWHIPVLQMADGEEKNWPFTAGQVRRLFEKHFAE